MPSSHRLLTIAFCSPALPESGVSNGIVTYTRFMRDALREQGHDVLVFNSDQIEHPDGRIVELPKPNRISGRIRLLLQQGVKDGSNPWARLHMEDAFRKVRRLGVDVIEIEETFGWAGYFAGRGVSIVERLHGPHVFGRDEVESSEQRKRGDERVAAELASFTRVQAVTSPSQLMLDELLRRYNLNLPLARTILNPMPIAPPETAWSIERANPSQIVCVGRFDLRKGADIVVRAFARAHQKMPSLKLVMVGPDRGLAMADGTTIHFNEFTAKEISAEARSSITFLGTQSEQQIADLRRKSVLAVVGSRFETFAYTVAEAMSIGMPVLASDIWGPSELIKDGINGRLIPVGDIEALAEAMVLMASDRAGLARMGRAARASASQLLSPDRIALQAVDVYREAIGALKR